MGSVWLIASCVWLGVASVSATEGADASCYGPGDVAGIVVGAIVATLVTLLALGAFYYWHKRRRDVGDSIQKTPLEDGGQQESKFAFDNPYFREDDSPPEKGQVNTTSADYPPNGAVKNGKANAEKLAPAPQNGAHSNGSSNGGGSKIKPKSRLSVVANPFAAVFSQNKKQQRTMDDSCLNTMEPERAVVPLKGHDFTGLGFNICGNMRDGIFVKDVLHRGPASESGQIKAGDRIVSVTVSFTKMVYEDALTILSYASPYDVQLELEKTGDSLKGPQGALAPPSSGLPGQGKHKLGSYSFSAGGQRLFHPLYRSQSIDDLTQIGKLEAGQQEATASSPKRSKSVGLSVLHQRSKSTVTNQSVLSPVSDPDGKGMPGMPVTGSLNERTLANAMVDGKRALESLWETKEDPSESSPGHQVKQKGLETLWPIDLREEVNLKDQNVLEDEDEMVASNDSSLLRKTKRKAPEPPKSNVETTVLIHRPDISKLQSEPTPERQRQPDEDSLELKVSRRNSEVSCDSLEEDIIRQESDSIDEKVNNLKSTSTLMNLSVQEEENPIIASGDIRVVHDEANVKPNIVHELDSTWKNPPTTSTPVSQRLISTVVGPNISRVTREEPKKPARKGRSSNSTVSTPSKSPSECSLSSDSSDDQRKNSHSKNQDQDLDKHDRLLSHASTKDYHHSVVELKIPLEGTPEIIEIQESELDGVMMSHRQFLLKQAKATGDYTPLNKESKLPSTIGFEAWSYADGSGISKNQTLNDSTSSHYRTALDQSQDNEILQSLSLKPQLTTIALEDGNQTAELVIINQTPDSTLKAETIDEAQFLASLGPPSLEPPPPPPGFP